MIKNLTECIYRSRNFYLFCNLRW